MRTSTRSTPAGVSRITGPLIKITFAPRFASLWPNTLGNQLGAPSANIGLNPHRNFYTAYSWSRDLRPFAAASDLSTPAYLGPIPYAEASFYATPAVPATSAARPCVRVGCTVLTLGLLTLLTDTAPQV